MVDRQKNTVLIRLAVIPITAFGLGTWQYYRLQWKSRLIQEFEKRMSNQPLILTKDAKYTLLYINSIF